MRFPTWNVRCTFTERRYLNLPVLSGKVENFLKRILVEFAKMVSTDFPGGVILLSAECRALSPSRTVFLPPLVERGSHGIERRLRLQSSLRLSCNNPRQTDRFARVAFALNWLILSKPVLSRCAQYWRIALKMVDVAYQVE